MTTDLYQRQLELEEESLGLGQARYRKEITHAIEAGREAELPPGLGLLNKMVTPTSIALHLWIRETAALKSARRNASLLQFLQQFDPDMLAFVTAREVVNGLSKQRRLQAVALGIVSILEDELEYNKLRKDAPGLYKKIMTQTKGSSSYRRKRIIMLLAKRRAGIEDTRENMQFRLKAGLFLLEKLRVATGLFVVHTARLSPKTSMATLRACPEVLEWLEKAHTDTGIMSPLHLPMLVPPADWSSPTNGGYLNPAVARAYLFKVRNKNYLEELRHTDLSGLYNAVNALQRTAWRINEAVLTVMSQVWDEGGCLGGLPARDNEPLPAKPWDIATNPVALKAWKREASRTHEKNARMESKRVSLSQKLSLARKFQPEAAIYFPWSLDWRGRAYPVPGGINPQADDAGKALLQFAEGKPLGETGAFWLAVHIANLFGVDKCSFEDRVAWVQENTEALLDSGLRPLDGQRFWASADKPYNALAACFEWVGYSLMGNEYVSHLPIAMDGSCNGLQNFSAMLRDEVGGKAVNLIPSPTPQDIYMEVAEVVKGKIEASSDPLAALWVGKITRSLVKRPVMTLPYGATKIGMRDQLLDHLRKLKAENASEELPDVEDPFMACAFLANVIYQSIGEVVIAARQAMDWLVAAAKVTSADGLPVRWTTPIGLPVLQMYRKRNGKVMNIQLGTARYQLEVSFDSDKLDTRRQTQGIAPNFVHSLDASHMMLTVNACAEAGITSFAMVHDSYGTLPADCELMYTKLRETFVDMYSKDVLGGFRDELASQLPEELAAELPALPPSGTLELEGVYESQYFFA